MVVGPVAPPGRSHLRPVAVMYHDRIAAHERSVEHLIPRELAPVLGARRDGSATADSSRGLLLTILGELVLPNGGSAWTQSLVGLMESLGVRDKAARQAIARTHDRGWLTRDRIGRQTRWTLSQLAVELLSDGAEKIYRLGSTPPPWDRQWLVLLASVPERDRNSRYRMTVGLGWEGFGSVGQGIWLSPHPDREPAAVELLRSLGVDAVSFRAELGALGSPRSLAEQAWDLPAVRAAYDEFLTDTEGAANTSIPDAEAAAGLVTLVHRWRRFPLLDPGLPEALLPDDWPGWEAARRFADVRAALAGPAHRWWREAEAGHDARVTAAS